MIIRNETYLPLTYEAAKIFAMADQAAFLQKQIRENAQDLGDFLGDLNRWTQDIKKKDEELKTTNAIKQLNVAPIRKVLKKEKKATDSKKEEKDAEKKSRISSYDYDSWSKFDVDAECDKVEKDDEEAGDESEEEEEVDLEAAQEIEEQQRLQRAILEKDKGNDLFKEGKFEAAINRYTRAAELDPRNAIVYANRAMALLKLERYAAAEDDCTRSLSIDSDYAKAIARRATARTKLKKYKSAIEDQEHLLKLQPNNKQELEKEVKNAEFNVKTSRKTRSNKPLRRIEIEEIGDDEEKKEMNLISKNNKQIKSSQDTKDIQKSGSSQITRETAKKDEFTLKVEFKAPSSPVQFETDFQKLKKNIDDFYRYFSAIPPEKYKSLFHHSIDEVLPRALECFHNHYRRNEKDYFNELCELAKVPRFEMARMFLSKNSKTIVKDIFKELLAREFKSEEEKSIAHKLAKSFGYTFS
eukprot:gene6067-6769_t